MARLYANENFRLRVVEILRELGHDVLTTKDVGNANRQIPDEGVLSFAASENRAVVTYNRKHFFQLHRQNPTHSGIVACTEDDDISALAHRIHEAIEAAEGNPGNQVIRVVRPNPPVKTANP